MSDNIQKIHAQARAAFEIVEHWPQEKVDEMVLAAGWQWLKPETCAELARSGVDESGIGVYADKLAKIRTKTLGSLSDLRGVKTCDIVAECPEKGLVKFAKPMGIVANIVPCTNPESTVCALGLNTLKTRNAMIVSPHPRAPRTSRLACEHGRRALRKIGAPVDLIQCLEHPSRKQTAELLKLCDFVVATGGAGLAEFVQASGTPCQTVGAGNVVSIVDETADLPAAAEMIVESKTFNNSSPCSSENAVALHESICEAMLHELIARGGYLCNVAEREKLRAALWPDDANLNRDVVGKPVAVLAAAAGLEVPRDARFLMVWGERPGPEDRFSGEKICLVLTVWKWNDFDEITCRICKMLEFSGRGHSLCIHSQNRGRQLELARRMKVTRISCNMSHALVNSGSWCTGLPFTETLACGAWAGNNSSENVNYRHLLNYTWLSTRIEEKIPHEEELFADYIDKWGRD